MNRREFILLLGGGPLTRPLAARAQQLGNIPRVGVLRPIGSAPHASVEALRQGLRELGYIEGQNVILDVRYADGKLDRLPELLAEFVRLNVAVIVTYGPQGTRAAKEATSTIPIVMGRMDDADGYGFVANLARPGGNITGVSFQSAELSTKWLELLKDVLPHRADIAVLWDADSTPQQLKTIENAGQSIGVTLSSKTVRRPEQFGEVFAAVQGSGSKGLVLLASPLFTSHMSRLAELAAAHGLAAIYMYRAFAYAGGLMSYGPLDSDASFSYRRAAIYVDKILKGAKPAELPVEQPTKFELVLNLKTAKMLSINIPPTMLGRADEVIE